MSELAELQAQILELQKKANRIAIQEKAAALDEIKTKIKVYGITMKELSELAKESTRTFPPVAVKYRHPQNAELTWTGRGRQPKWMESYLADGGKIEDLVV